MVGIYLLHWQIQNLMYVGQSIDVLKRFKEHLRKLNSNTHTNYKVTKAFELYGEPILTLLQECSLDKLNELEIYWTKELNSLHGPNGLNIVEGGKAGYGAFANSSKYSKLQVLLAFRSLYTSNYVPRKQTAELLKVSTDLLNDIAKGVVHLWLKEKYPKSYVKMLELKQEKYLISRSQYHNNVRGILVSPDGIKFEITNGTSFAKEHGLIPCKVNLLLQGKSKSHKKWKLFTE